MASTSSRFGTRGESQLQLVRGIAQSREQKLAGEVGELMRQRASAVATVEQLRGYLHEYQEQENDCGARPLMVLENERRFVKRLNTALDQQCTHVQRLDESASAKMQLWQREHANLQALDRLLAKRALAHSRLQERGDQKESDARSLRTVNTGDL